MSNDSPREYRSPVRKEQAAATKQRILDAGRELFLARGFDGTTIEAIAKQAGVAAPTVYATLGSKSGIVAELLNRARFGEGHRELVGKALAETDARARLGLIAEIARRVYDGERAEMDLVRSVSGVSAELAEMERQHETARFENQSAMVDLLVTSPDRKPDLDVDTIRDVLWALTGRDSYRMLVIKRGWPSDRYATWLGELLVCALLKP